MKIEKDLINNDFEAYCKYAEEADARVNKILSKYDDTDLISNIYKSSMVDTEDEFNKKFNKYGVTYDDMKAHMNWRAWKYQTKDYIQRRKEDDQKRFEYIK